MKYTNKIFSEALSELLKEKKVKLRSLAAKTSLNYSYFSKLTRRKSSPPIETLINISNALEIKPEYFIEYRIHKLNILLKNNPEIIIEVLNFAYSIEQKSKLKVAEEKIKYDK
ncbi:MAG: helix-turn-helix transcriptional regulator [Actinobacteria bacterium]|nr:helix-turn-helix transcriptional regulator [Actinomycetota bacterium]